MITVALVDDDPTVRKGLPTQIQAASDEFSVLGAFPTVEALLEDEHADLVNVVLLDVLRGEDRLNRDLTTLAQLDAKVAIVTVDTTALELVPVLRRHAVSVVHKMDIVNDAMLVLVITQVARGGRILDPEVQRQLNDDLPLPRLTPRQEDVLREVIKGSPTKKIAEDLRIEPQSVQDHLEDIERRFADAGYPIREDGESIRDRKFRLSQKAREIGYFGRNPRV